MSLSRRVYRITFNLVTLIAVLFYAATARATIRYEVSLAHPEQHLFHVSMTIPDVAGSVTVALPAWNALYQIRDFSAHLQAVEALAGTVPAKVEKLDKQTWRVTGMGRITIQYAAYWDETGPFATQLNGEHAFVNPAMILMYVPERRAEGVQWCLKDLSAGWTSSMDSAAGSPGAHPMCSDAADYDALADTPMEVGKFEEFSLPGFRREIRVVIHGDNWKKKRVEGELTRICKYELQLMDGAPFEHYTFILHIGSGGRIWRWNGACQFHGHFRAVG